MRRINGYGNRWLKRDLEWWWGVADLRDESRASPVEVIVIRTVFGRLLFSGEKHTDKIDIQECMCVVGGTCRGAARTMGREEARRVCQRKVKT